MSVSSPSNTSNTAADQAADKPMTRPDNAHSTGVADSGRWSTKRIAMYALFVALSMAVSFIEFPIIPGVQWLKYDPSGIVCLVAGFAFGPAAAVIVSVLGFVPHLFTNPWGTLMAVLVALALSVPASLIYKKNKTRKGALIGIIWFVTGMHWAFALGTILMGIVADLVAGIGGYASRKINAISYMLYSLGGTGSYLVFFADPDGWAKTMLGNGTEQGYIDTMQATGNSAILAVMLIGTLAAALISAAVGSKMLKKQFEKAGITA